MSWLYTILFAGLMLGSDNAPATQNHKSVNKAQAIRVAMQQREETERFEQSYPLSANGKVCLSNVNGSITVEAWDRNEVKLSYVKSAETKERLADIEIRIDARPDSFSVETDYNNNWNRGNDARLRNNGRMQVEYRLMVPRAAVINEIEAVNGSVTISNFVNITKVSAVNGNVNAANLRGSASLSTVNGEVLADFDRIEASGKIELSTVNGKVNLQLPSDSNATLKADSLNGNITNDFGLPVRKGKYVGRDLFGRLGSGENKIQLSSVNGSLTITRKNDGKSPSQVTDLLPTKGKDDDSWDDSNEKQAAAINSKIEKESAQANKEAMKAAREVMKNTPKVIADTRYSVNSLPKELEKVTADSIGQAAASIEEATKLLDSADFKEKIKEKMLEPLLNQKELWNGLVDAGFVPQVEKKNGSFAVTGVPKVTIEARDCDIKVHGWDRQEVQYVLTSLPKNRMASPPDVNETHTITDITLKINRTGRADRTRPEHFRMLPDHIESISANEKNAVVKLKNGTVEKFDMAIKEQKNEFERRYGLLSRVPPAMQWGGFGEFAGARKTTLEIYVPKKANVKVTTDGEIRFEDVSGDSEINGGDETINVRDAAGTLQVSSTDGRIRVIGFKGEISAKSTDGMINLEGDFKKLKAGADGGDIFLTLPDGTQADVEANCPDIKGEGIDLVRLSEAENLSKYKIGKGGALFQVRTDGEIHIRGNGILKAAY